MSEREKGNRCTDALSDDRQTDTLAQ